MSAGRFVRDSPILGPIIRRVAARFAAFTFTNSSDYWERRYKSGRNSGAGSYGRLARFKANTINAFVADHQVTFVVEFGCGDGAQLELAEYPTYVGLDVSAKAIALCEARFADDPNKRFLLLGLDDPGHHELGLSLDVIYHLIEDEVFESHMGALFNAASRYVVIYSSNTDEPAAQPHVRHRKFTDWIEKNRHDWRLLKQVANAYPCEDGASGEETSFADFYFFERIDD